MSDSSIGLKPVIEEPSKPIPPSNASSSSEALIENLFSWPSTSVNQSRMKRTSRSRTTSITSSAVSRALVLGWPWRRSLSARDHRGAIAQAVQIVTPVGRIYRASAIIHLTLNQEIGGIVYIAYVR